MSAEHGVDPPIACSLDVGALADRIEEWRALVATHVITIEAEPTAVHLVLATSDEALLRAVELAQREKQCCPFFDVAVNIGAQQRTLSLRAPEGADDVMATFVTMLRP